MRTVTKQFGFIKVFNKQDFSLYLKQRKIFEWFDLAHSTVESLMLWIERRAIFFSFLHSFQPHRVYTEKNFKYLDYMKKKINTKNI